MYPGCSSYNPRWRYIVAPMDLLSRIGIAARVDWAAIKLKRVMKGKRRHSL